MSITDLMKIDVIPHHWYARKSTGNRMSASIALQSIGMLLKSGHSLEKAVSITSEKSKISKSIRRVLRTGLKKLGDGGKLSDLTEKYQEIFINPTTEIIKAAEENGNLPDGLFRSANIIKGKVEVNSHRIHLRAYMTHLLILFFLVITFVDYAILPTFMKVAENSIIYIHGMHRFCLNSITFFAKFSQLALYLTISYFLAGLFPFIGRIKIFYRLRQRIYLLNLPLVKGRRYINLATGLYGAGDVLKMGGSLQLAFETAGRTSNNYWLNTIWSKASESIASGESPHKILMKAQILPVDIASLFTSREISQETCYAMADFLRLRGEYLSKRSYNMIYMMIYLFIGIATALLLATIYLFNANMVGVLM
ncbi:type II secretion system F family protein [bacterium]|nr:type II secretion system F family protein [bacterium]